MAIPNYFKNQINHYDNSSTRSLCTEIYNTLNQLNPGFFSDIFKLSSSNRAARKQQVLNLETTRPSHFNFSEKNLRALDRKIWNNLLPPIKSAENLSFFKNLIKSWDGVSCQCNLCKTFEK